MNTAQKYGNEMQPNQQLNVYILERIRNEEADPTIGPGRMARLSLPVNKNTIKQCIYVFPN